MRITAIILRLIGIAYGLAFFYSTVHWFRSPTAWRWIRASQPGLQFWLPQITAFFWATVLIPPFRRLLRYLPPVAMFSVLVGVFTLHFLVVYHRYLPHFFSQLLF